MLNLCYSIMSHSTLILFHYASMLTLQDSLKSRALWLPQGMILGSLECIIFLHIVGLIPEQYWLSFDISIWYSFMKAILPVDVFNLDCSLSKNSYFWFTKLSRALAKKQGLDILSNSEWGMVSSLEQPIYQKLKVDDQKYNVTLAAILFLILFQV